MRYHAGFGDQIVSFGSVPSVGEALVGLTSEAILGSRPKPPAQQPPFRAGRRVPHAGAAEPERADRARRREQRKVDLKAAP